MATLDNVVVPVGDLDRAKAFYAAILGTAPVVDAPYYVGFDLGGPQLGLDPQGTPGGVGALPYLACDDLAAAVDAGTGAGGTVAREPRDVGGGKLVAVVLDPDGNGIGLTQNPR